MFICTWTLQLKIALQAGKGKKKKKSINNPQSAEKQSSYIAFIILPAVPLFFSRGEQTFTYKGLTLKD